MKIIVLKAREDVRHIFLNLDSGFISNIKRLIANELGFSTENQQIFDTAGYELEDATYVQSPQTLFVNIKNSNNLVFDFNDPVAVFKRCFNIYKGLIKLSPRQIRLRIHELLETLRATRVALMYLESCFLIQGNSEIYQPQISKVAVNLKKMHRKFKECLHNHT